MTTAAELADLTSQLTEPVHVLDVGARWGALEPWSPLGSQVRVVGFDPDAAECTRLNGLDTTGLVRYVPAALGPAPGTATLYVTKEPACSSLYPPNPEFYLRPGMEIMTPEREVTITLVDLDSWMAEDGIERFDFAKLDTQGSELGVLEGASKALGGFRMLELEVEFNPMYLGQPLFGDVDRFLRDRGFVLWRLGHHVHYGIGTSEPYERVELAVFDNVEAAWQGGAGQIAWAHAWYVAGDWLRGEGRAGAQQALRDACIAYILGFPDLASAALGSGR